MARTSKWAVAGALAAMACFVGGCGGQAAPAAAPAGDAEHPKGDAEHPKGDAEQPKADHPKGAEHPKEHPGDHPK